MGSINGRSISIYVSAAVLIGDISVRVKKQRQVWLVHTWNDIMHRGVVLSRFAYFCGVWGLRYVVQVVVG